MRLEQLGFVAVCAAAALAVAGISTAEAKAMRSAVAFNTGIAKKTANQPADGVEVAYQITLKGGELDGCKVDIVEQLRPRDEGKWGFFDIAGKAACANGGFSYLSAGSWDGNGFHAAGTITEGTGSFSGKGRIAQLGGGGKSAADGTTDISYELVVDTPN